MSKNIKGGGELSPLPAYELEYEEYLTDVSGCGLVFRHKKSGARVCVISTDDKNKVFYIGFRTPVSDDTGVPHIIEHTVLCGSDKYPSRDPFMLLAKGSLNTFLNAMTYPDKTVYPVASCNDHDFENLMSVYADAVFHPNIYKYKEIFMQEGWHYELENPDGELKINGIVYNEMKGVLSSPDSSIFDEVCKVMFPDTAYGRNSGGDPEHIPELTYEQYLDFHRTHYHPSNSYIFLWGDIDVEERLGWLDENYLSDYDRIDVSGTEIGFQQPFGGLREATSYYSVEADAESSDSDNSDGRDERTYLSYSALTCESSDVVSCVAWDIIADALINTPGAPVRQALLDAGIGQDVFGGIMEHLRQSGIFIMAKNADARDKHRFYEIIINGFREAAKGIDRKSLEAAINSREFSYREADYGSTPRGLSCGLDMLQSWIYDDRAAFTYMRGGDVYAELREKLSTRFYEELIEKYVLDSVHSVLLSYEPKPGMTDMLEEKLASQLSEYKAGLSPEEISGIITATENLRRYQSAPSTPEEQSCIPSLKRSDLERESLPLSNNETDVCGVKTVIHDGFTGGIAYITFYFDISELPEKWIPYVGQLGGLLGRMDTAEHGYLDLSNEVRLNVGKMSFAPVNVMKSEARDKSRLMFSLSLSCFENKVGDALRLSAEIITSTKFKDPKRLRELIAESRSDMQSRINSRGNSVAASRLISYFSRHAVINEWLGGISAYDFLKTLQSGFSSFEDRISDSFAVLASYIFSPERMLISVSSGDDGMRALEAALPEFISKLGDHASESGILDGCNGFFEGIDGDILTPVRKNEGFMMSSQVQFVGMGGNLTDAGYKYSGSLKVLENVLNCEYLYGAVRVKGGAYGCGCRFGGVSGNVFFTSFRDPHLKTTEEVYMNAGEWIRELDPDEEALTRYIIGTFSGFDRPLSAREKADRSMSAYLSGISYEDIQRERSEIIDTTAEQLRAAADIIDAVCAQNYRCTLGNAKKLRESNNFDNLVPLA